MLTHKHGEGVVTRFFVCGGGGGVLLFHLKKWKLVGVNRALHLQELKETVKLLYEIIAVST